MTIEEKAKAYDEAVNKIKPLYEQAKRDGNPIWSTYEYFVPELRESEEETTRKELLDFVRSFWADHKEKLPQASRWVTYLEKQGEMKDTHVPDRKTILKIWEIGNEWKEGDKEGLTQLAYIQKHWSEYVDEQKEQKPCGCVNVESEYDKGWRAGHKAGLKDAEEQKPAEWSEEDEKRVKQLIYDTEHIRAEYEKRKKELGESFNDGLIKDCDEQIAWLKSLSLKKRLEDVDKLCSNEGSEEDDMLMDELESYILYDKEFNDEQKAWRIKRLKSLRPQPHWKPSEEQMKALNYALQVMNTDLSPIAARTYQGLQEIQQNLKKLM